MKDVKESVIVYQKQVDICKKYMTPEQFGRLMFALFDNDPDVAVDKDIALAFEFMNLQKDINAAKYARICERNRENGIKGGRPKKTQKTERLLKKPNGYLQNPNDNDNGNDISINENGNDNVSVPDISLSLISYLNQKTGGTYTDTEQTRELIESRLSEGYTEEDLRTVIDKKAIEWNCSGNMRSNLRPSVLFGEKFEEYLNAPVPMEVERVREKSDRAAKLRDNLDANRDELEQVESRMEEIKNETGSEELKDLRFRKAYLEEVIENMMRRLEVT